MAAAAGAGAGAGSSSLYSFIGAAAAIVGVAATKQLLRRDPITRLPRYTAADPDTLVPYEHDAARDGKDVKIANNTKHYAVGVDADRPVRVAKAGLAASKPQTVMQALAKCVANQPNSVAFKQERGADMKWVEWTWSQYNSDVMTVAKAFIALGMKATEAVNILAFNSPEWFIADLAAIAAGGKVAGIYPTNTPDACRYITEHSEAPIVVVENQQQLTKYLQIRDTLPLLKALVLITGEIPAGANVQGKVPVFTWEQVLQKGKDAGAAVEAELKARIAGQTPGQCCTLIYTSGTTGNPKAVMISHDNCTWTAQITASTQSTWHDHEHLVSYLPLSHIAANMIDIHVPMDIVGRLNIPTTVWFARPDALKASLAVTLRAARPTMLLGVPRVWEKIEEKMREVGATAKGMKKKLVDWAKGLGTQGFVASQVDSTETHYPRFHWIAKKLIFSAVRKTLGLDRCTLAYSGAAPISQQTLNYFGALDIPIWEVYGMSECTGPQCLGRKGYFKVGSVGTVLQGTELKVDHVAGRDKPNEGELCYRGRHIMMGYMKDANKTAESIDADGYLHSGDVGRIDDMGLVYITGRIKELIIGAGGENIAPVPVEDAIKVALPGLSNVMMYGDRRKYNTALFTLRVVVDLDTGVPTNQLTGAALKVSEDSKTVEQALKDPKWKAYLDAGLAKANKQAVSNAQTVQKYTVVPVDFSIPGGELTATLKLKRNVVTEKYIKELDAMY